MLYRLKHLIFGWDYIAWENSCANGIARVHRSQDGTVWFWQYRLTKVSKRITKPSEVIWLTCHPSQYIN